MLALENLIEPLAWALVHSLWQGALVGLGLLAAMFVTRPTQARLRYSVSQLALILIPILAVGSIANVSASKMVTPAIENPTASVDVTETSAGAVPPVDAPSSTAPNCGSSSNTIETATAAGYIWSAISIR